MITSLLNFIRSLFAILFPSKSSLQPVQPQPIVKTPPIVPTPASVVPAPLLFSIDQKIVQAFIMQESGGNDNAFGDQGLTDHAYGCLQIRKPVCDDVNHRYGTAITAQQMLGNRTLSIETFTRYMEIYCKSGSFEDMARTWNGGPGWRLHPTWTDIYWKEIQQKYNATPIV